MSTLFEQFSSLRFNSEEFIIKKNEDGTHALIKLSDDSNFIYEVKGLANLFMSILVTKNQTSEELITLISEKFKIPREKIIEDIEPFLNDLLKNEIIKLP